MVLELERNGRRQGRDRVLHSDRAFTLAYQSKAGVELYPRYSQAGNADR